MSIRFGTSGWHAVVADECTFSGVRRVTEAIRAHVAGTAKAGNPPEYNGRFKYIGELINENKTILGGEKSAGLSIKGHYPEKDGILACLLAAEAVAAREASLTEQLKHLRGIRIGKGLGGAS